MTIPVAVAQCRGTGRLLLRLFLITIATIATTATAAAVCLVVTRWLYSCTSWPTTRKEAGAGVVRGGSSVGLVRGRGRGRHPTVEEKESSSSGGGECTTRENGRGRRGVG